MIFALTTIEVSDMNASLSFYSGLLGVPVVRRMSSPQGFELAFLGEEGAPQLELICKGQKVAVGPQIPFSIGFHVRDAQSVIEQSGGGHTGPFQAGPGMRFYFISDPDGYRVQLLEKV